jgi:putative inorganic carbon (HCO3(-)) transporter
MRDILLISIVIPMAILALKRPWIGVMLWTWLSIMNPHRYTYGFAYSAPLAALAVAVTMIGLMSTKERESPVKGTEVKIFILFIVWMTLSWLFGFDPETDYEQWKKVMKVDLMILVALALLHTKKHILALTWVAAGSLALLGAKGGLYTLTTGGGGRVWGPPGSFIADNNEFALSLVMAIPLLRFLQTLVSSRWAKYVMIGFMLLCALAALGSQSRGALLALTAMTVLLWWRGKNKMSAGIILLAAAPLMILFMPDSWTERMNTISEFETDRSAMGRFSAWWTAWGIALHHPFGAGFNIVRPELVAIYSPYPDFVYAAHSIYFLVLGNHGFVGLALFLSLWLVTWNSAAWIRREGTKQPETKWCSDLGAMCQVSLIGYAVGGAFLSLSYFDLPYNIMAIVVLTRKWISSKAWENEIQISDKTQAESKKSFWSRIVFQ